MIIAKCLQKMQLNFILTFIRAFITEEGNCAPEIFYIGFNGSYFILPESRDLLGFYCRASIVYNIMLLTLKYKSRRYRNPA